MAHGQAEAVWRLGASWHEYRLAIDTSDQWLKALDKYAATEKQTTLMKFGLFKPLTTGNKTGVLEDWHMQPIETRGVSDRKLLMPVDIHTGLLPHILDTKSAFTCREKDGQFVFNSRSYFMKTMAGISLMTSRRNGFWLTILELSKGCM